MFHPLAWQGCNWSWSFCHVPCKSWHCKHTCKSSLSRLVANSCKWWQGKTSLSHTTFAIPRFTVSYLPSLGDRPNCNSQLLHKNNFSNRLAPMVLWRALAVWTHLCSNPGTLKHSNKVVDSSFMKVNRSEFDVAWTWNAFPATGWLSVTN